MRGRGKSHRRGTERGGGERGESRVRKVMRRELGRIQILMHNPLIPDRQMKSIFLSDSDEEAIVGFIKQHEELYDNTNDSFKDKQKKERLWETLATTRNLPSRSGSRLNVPDMASSLRQSQDKQLRRAQNDRLG